MSLSGNLTGAYDGGRHRHAPWVLLVGAVLIFVPAFLLLRGDGGPATPDQPAVPAAEVTVTTLQQRGLPIYEGQPTEGVKLYVAGKHSQAVEKLALALGDPTQEARKPFHLYYYARALDEAGKSHESLAAFEQLATDHADSPYAGDALGFRAEQAAAAGRHDEQLELQQAIVERYPESRAARSAGRALAELAEKKGDPEAALRAWSLLLAGPLDNAARKAALARARALAAKVVYSPAPMTGATFHEVSSGETLGKIARRYGTSVGLLRKVNGKTDNRIYIRERLKVLGGTFHIAVHKSNFSLTLFLGGIYLMDWEVGLGEHGKTPTGDFLIISKLENPVWWWQGRKIPFGDPRHKIGTRWLGFKPKPGITGYGIHGTTEPETIGKNLSAGCIRMHNEHVEELFEMVPRGTRVDIFD